jgi:hypothetical protein
LLPPDAAVSQSDGNTIVANTVPAEAAAQFAGTEPLRISKVGDAPIVVSIWSKPAFRVSIEN